jgi:hypothetical protein
MVVPSGAEGGRSSGVGCEAGSMVTARTRVAAALAGAASWTALEYGLHRFVMHEMRGRGLPSVEHLKHHADVTYFSPASKKIGSAAATTIVAYPLATALAGRQRARSFVAGMIGMYFGYEVAHRRTHTHPPKGRYGRWARRNHLHHHFGAPMRNFGVTIPVWDRVFGTSDAVGTISVPRRMAPVWLLDESGEVHARFADDYTVKGSRLTDARLAEHDRVDAFANRAPGA